MTEKEKTKSALLDPKRGTMFSEMLAYWCWDNYGGSTDGKSFDVYATFRDE